MKIYEFDLDRYVLQEYSHEGSPIRTHKYFIVIYKGNVHVYILVPDIEKLPVKYQYKNKWFCLNNKEVLNLGIKDKDVKVEDLCGFLEQDAKEIPTWVGVYEAEVGKFLKNPYYNNKELIKFIISRL